MAANDKKCRLCEQQVQEVDYKDISLLRKFISPQGKIINKKRSGTCSKHQRALARAVKRARILALLPFTKEK